MPVSTDTTRDTKQRIEEETNIDIVELSAVYYREGFRAAAEGVATALGLDPSTVVPLGQPISAVDDQADVVMAIGNDFTE